MARARDSAPSARSESASARARRRRLERLAEVAEDRLGGAPDDERRVGREEQRADGHRHRPACQRLEEAIGRVARVRGLDRGQQQRRDGGLGDEQLAAAEDHRGAHGEHDDEPDLQRPVADRVDDQVGDGEAEHDAGDELGRAPPALLVARPERDDRGDRGEDRPLVVDRQQRRQVVGGHRRRSGLQDRQQARPQRPRAQSGADRSRRSASLRAWSSRTAVPYAQISVQVVPSSEVSKRNAMTALAPLPSASSTSRSWACRRPSASIFVMPFSSPPTSDLSDAPICEPTLRERTVSPKTSPMTSSIL